MFSRIAAFWERMGSRERRLTAILGVALVVCVGIYAAFSINDGLRALEDKNDETRAALRSLQDHREDLLNDKAQKGDAVGMIGEQAIPLATYLEKAGADVKVEIRAQQEKPTLTKGKFHELALQITLFDVSLDQLAGFLKRIETNSPIVVTQRLYVKRSALTKEKLDRVEITVATYERVKGGGKGEGTAAAGDRPDGKIEGKGEKPEVKTADAPAPASVPAAAPAPTPPTPTPAAAAAPPPPAPAPTPPAAPVITPTARPAKAEGKAQQ